MSDYRRWKVAGGTFFFTLVAFNRAKMFLDSRARTILGNQFRECEKKWPFQIDAMVLLPEHLHALWTLPPGDFDYSKRWGWIKKEFTKEWLSIGGREQPISRSRRQRGDRGIWQPRYWEHTIEDEVDFERHFDYIHYNPVKHKLVNVARLWPYSSFHRYCKAGIYDPDWGNGSQSPMTFDELDQKAMEFGE